VLSIEKIKKEVLFLSRLYMISVDMYENAMKHDQVTTSRVYMNETRRNGWLLDILYTKLQCGNCIIVALIVASCVCGTKFFLIYI
jgi:hypothetical protein